MNEATPVANASSSTAKAKLRPAPRLASPIEAAAPAGAAMPRASAQTTSARRTLRMPAVRMVPGSPKRSMRMKPLASTPIAAPKLLVK